MFSESDIRQRRFQIRRADANDADAIAGCLSAAFTKYQGDYTPAAFEDTVTSSDGIRRRLHEMSLFVAVVDAKVIGTIGCLVKGREGHLRGMAVSPEWQGTAVAAALLQEAETEFREKGCGHITLDTTAPLQRAIRFYERHGFSVSGRVSDFFGMPLYEYSKGLL